MKAVHKVRGRIWLYPGDVAWHFVSVDTKTSAVLKAKHGKSARGFGSLPVSVTIGKETWQTSIFPDKRSGTYLLPLKAEVRRKTGIAEGDDIVFTLRVR